MARVNHDFAKWLAVALEGRRQVDLVRRSGAKANGRPRIDPSRVTGWMRGERPSFDLTVVAARALDRPPLEALEAAGYRVEPGTLAGELDPEQEHGQLLGELASLTPEERRAALAFIQWWRSERVEQLAP